MSLTVDDLVAQSGVKNIDEECSDADILQFGDFCDPWKQVGLYLRLTKAQLSAIDDDNRTVSMKRLGVLQKWKEINAFKATYRVLIEALLKCGKTDTALKVCEIVAQKQGGGTSTTSRPEQAPRPERAPTQQAPEAEGENEADTSNAHVRKRKATRNSKGRASATVADFSDPDDGPGPSKVTRAILVLLVVGGVCAVGWYIFVISTTHSDGAHKSDRESEPTEASRKRAGSSMDAQIKGDEIQNFNELIQAVKEIGNWRGLCSNLGVGQEVMDPLIHSTDVVDTKKMECLRAYFDGGEAKWSKVVKAVAMYPVNNKRVALKIAEAHGLNFRKTVEDKL